MTNSDSLHPAFAGARLLVLDEVSDAKQLGSPPALYRETLRTLYAPEAGRYAYSIADSTAPSWGEPRKSLIGHWLSGPLHQFDTAAAQPGP
jgi:hypothetical protein